MAATNEPTAVPTTCTVNGQLYRAAMPPSRLLIDFLREDLGLTGVKRSCDSQVCGACTVLVDGRAISSCTYLACEVDGREVETVEGLSEGGRIHPLQDEFVEHSALQCGFCTPGMIMMALALLRENLRPSRSQIREYLAGNICRCAEYRRIEDAVAAAARRLSGRSTDVAVGRRVEFE